MPTLHLMVGLPCSGKTTYAKALAEKTGAIRFTPDEWQPRLFGMDAKDPDHDRRHSEIEAIIWDVAKEVLRAGVDIITDFGCWAEEERVMFRERAEAVGANYVMHYTDVGPEELLRRLRERNASGRGDVFVIEEADMRRYAAQFEVPEKADE